MNKFSDGPWQTHRDPNGEIGIYMTDPNGTCGPQVCKVLVENLERETDSDEQAGADATLIAAAPLMFEICEELLCTVGADGELNHRTADLSLVEIRRLAASVVDALKGGVSQ